MILENFIENLIYFT